MRMPHPVRAMLILFMGLLLPLEQAHCALMPFMSGRGTTVAVAAEHPDDDGDDCCHEAPPTSHPAPPADPCCSVGVQILAVSPSSAVCLTAPTVGPEFPGITPCASCDPDARRTLVLGYTPFDRSGSPPEPQSGPHSLRGPPDSA